MSESELKYRQIVENAHEGICEVDADGKIAFANSHMAEILGYTIEEMIGRPVYEMLGEPYRDISKKLFESRKRGVRESYEAERLRKDGAKIDLKIDASPMIEKDGRFAGAIYFFSDISSRVKAERERNTQLHFLQLLIDNMPLPIWYKDINGIYRGCNKAFETFCGLPREKIIGKTVYYTRPKELADIASRIDQETFKSPGAKSYETSFQHEDGAKHELVIYKSTYTDQDGKVAGLIGVLMDITERKRMEDQIRSLAKFPSDNPNPILRLSREGVIIEANKSSENLLKIYGSKVGAPAPKNWQNIVSKTFATGTGKDMEIMYDGKVILFSAVPVVEEGYVNFYGRDITDRKRAEEKLNEQLQFLQVLMDTIPSPIFYKDKNGVYLGCNKAFTEYVGLPKEKIVGKTAYEIGPERQADEALRVDRELLSELGSISYDFVVYHPDGTARDVIVNKSSYLDADGGVEGVVGVMVDITARKKAERALQEHLQFLQVLVETIPSPVFFKDKNGVYLGCNKAFVEYVGLPKEKIIGKTAYDCGPKYLADISNKIDQELFNNPGFKSYETVFEQLDGSKRDVVMNRATYANKEGDIVGVITVVFDITERKRMEEELKKHTEHLEELVEERTKSLREAERFATIGQVASMIGHDLRSPLQVIVDDVFMAKRKADQMSARDVSELADHIKVQVNYMSSLVSDLQDLARPIKANLSDVEAKPMFEDILSTLQVPGGVKASVEAPSDLIIRADSFLMKRALINLANNAIQAMPEGGNLTFKTSKTDGVTSIEVVDTGTGIPEETLNKLFTLFFTTKSKGIGLGLTVVKKIVEAHSGTIAVESRVGSGTKFTIKLPS